MFNNQFSPYPFMGPQMGQSAPFLPQVPQPSTAVNDGPVVLYAPSAKEFANVSVQPGRQALVISQNDPFIAFKSADAMGMVNTTLYRLEPVTPEQVAGPAPEYVTRQEFQQTIQQLLDNMTKPAAARQAKKEAATE